MGETYRRYLLRRVEDAPGVVGRGLDVAPNLKTFRSFLVFSQYREAHENLKSSLLTLFYIYGVLTFFLLGKEWRPP